MLRFSFYKSWFYCKLTKVFSYNIVMENIAVINLKNVKNNALKIKKRLPKGCRFCAVVKADGYGHGGVEVATYIHDVADCFAVAFVSEGVKLRLSGVKKDILVLLPASDDELDIAIEYNLTLSAFTKGAVEKINRVALEKNKKVKIHIKYNTGMNRLGVNGLDNLKALLEFSLEKRGIIVDGVYSHYANPNDKISRERATNQFLLANKLVKGYNKNITCHISASGGFLHGQFFDMVRVGILLYGYTPYITDKIAVKKALAVYSPVIQGRTVKAGDSALYGDCLAVSDTEISLIPYGYADGLFRAKISGQYNNRCMDISAVETKKIKGVCLSKKIDGFALNKVGGKKYIPVMVDAEKTAKEYDTISYEVLTKCALRAEKIYIK